MNRRHFVLLSAIALLAATILAASLPAAPLAAAPNAIVPDPLNITAATGRRVVGAVTSWQSSSGGQTVENLAGLSPANELLVFYRAGADPWRVDDVTAATGAYVVESPVTHWQTGGGDFLAGRSQANELLLFSRPAGGGWIVENLTRITGEFLTSAATSWLSEDGGEVVEHIAGQFRDGRLLVFFRVGGRSWRVVDVTAVTGQSISGRVTDWMAEHNNLPTELLAGRGREGDLLVFSWASNRDWQVENVSRKVGRRVSGPVADWQTLDTDNFTTPTHVEHLAARGEDGALLVFQRFEGLDWFVTDVTKRGGGLRVAGLPGVYQITDGEGNVKALGVRDTGNSLVLYWWKFTRGWQRVDLSAITGRPIAYDPHGYTVGGEERLAAVDSANNLLLFYDYDRPRLLTDGLRAPFMWLSWARSPSLLLPILWDWKNPAAPAPSKAAVEAALFGPRASASGFFRENSNDQHYLDSAGTLGWYAAQHPFTYYACPSAGYDDTHPDAAALDQIGCDRNGFTRDPGWVDPHVEKWAEAVELADADFNFAAFDHNRDRILQPSELGIVIVLPQNSPYGTVRAPMGSEVPPTPLVADGVKIPLIAEFYTGNPPNFSVVTHELSHLFLNAADMYGGHSSAPGYYSLMSAGYSPTHLDPFHKLKLGWVHAQIIFRSGEYSLQAVETSHDVWILMDPARGTDEYFIVENRWRRPQNYDSGMPDNGGLAVWHIMENPDVYGSVAPPPLTDPASWAAIEPWGWSRRGIWLIRPVWSLPVDDLNGLWDGAQPGADHDLLSNDPNPIHGSLLWADGTPSGFELRDISAAGPVMTARITVP